MGSDRAPVSLADIEAAARAIAGQVEQTPCVLSKMLSSIAGCELWLKFENLQFTASFKERGALNRLLGLTPEERRRGVCAMSAGNHAQGVAYHARRLGIPATIVMPIGTPATKANRTREYGAEVIIHGANLSEAAAEGERIAAERGLIVVHPYDDPAIIAGQGTAGLEIAAAVPDAEIIVVPIGGGGLISGIAIAAKALIPGVRVIGAESRTYPSMSRALAGEEAPCPDALTIAEGIAVKTAGALTREIVRSHVDDILLVDEGSIERAVALLLSVEKTVVEGAGAAGLAAILDYRDVFAGKRVVAPLTGGNIDLRVLAAIALRELARAGQLARIEVVIRDQAGALAKVATIFSEAGANILEVDHNRLSLLHSAKGASLSIVAEVQDREHATDLVARLRERGFDAREIAH